MSTKVCGPSGALLDAVGPAGAARLSSPKSAPLRQRCALTAGAGPLRRWCALTAGAGPLRRWCALTAGAGVVWLMIAGWSAAVAAEGAVGGDDVLVAESIRRSLWEWDSEGRRDPFIFRQPETEESVSDVGQDETVVIVSGEVGTDDTTTTQTTSTPATDVRKQRLHAKKLAEGLAASAFAALGRRDYARAEGIVAKALNRMRTVRLEDPESRKLEEKLVRLYNTAGRLRKRAEVETEFRNLKITIGGIVWQPVNPVAVINDRVVKKGDTVLGARVEEIRPGEVVFDLKGVRVSKSP